MNVLLFSMPDSFEHTPSFAMRFPNGALASLAGNVDAHHDVAIADLVLVQHAVPQTVRELVTTRAPDIVGLSVMTFQRKTAYKVIAFVRALRPEAWIVVGGYDPSLAPETYEDPALGVDFIVRGEGDITFCKLLRTIKAWRRLRRRRGFVLATWRPVRAQSTPARESFGGRGPSAEAGGPRA